MISIMPIDMILYNFKTGLFRFRFVCQFGWIGVSC